MCLCVWRWWWWAGVHSKKKGLTVEFAYRACGCAWFLCAYAGKTSTYSACYVRVVCQCCKPPSACVVVLFLFVFLLSMFVYMSVYMYICMFVFIYINIRLYMSIGIVHTVICFLVESLMETLQTDGQNQCYIIHWLVNSCFESSTGNLSYCNLGS